jgi:hypothetical protein
VIERRAPQETKERSAGAEKKVEGGTRKVELQNTPASGYGNSAFNDLSSFLFSAPVVRARALSRRYGEFVRRR